ncbi:MAG: 2,3-bisphosphoglycerate-independent phosphoglycerate mutase [Betaproteobacteria bacterium]|nr:2,3-bisphosphoglycerate-independent phosphoglycerate mutase [Betaproteobacteria bacterium]
MATKPVLLMIFDGFGINPSRVNNAWAQARTPHLDYYFANHPHTSLQTSGLAVGLPDGQFGSSEVGHLTMGAGRILQQDLMRVQQAIVSGALAQNPTWTQMLEGARRLHLVGMVSDGGVHSHIDHLVGLLDTVAAAGVAPIVHMITDGRDTPPRAAAVYAERIESVLARLGRGRIATVSGRYCAMDRIAHWDRTEKAWAAMILGLGQRADSAKSAIEAAYARGEGDEFIVPTIVGDPASSIIGPDEPVLFFNFRSDRMRQIAAAVGLRSFDAFARGDAGTRRVVTLTRYDAKLPFPVLFPPEYPEHGLAQVLSEAGLRQFHCAETEKYPHVTYFFNGGHEEPFPGEDRAIIASPRIATYDLKPEMSAPLVAERVIQAIEEGGYAFVLVNFANADMVGHTANPAATVRAVETLDLQSHRVIRAATARGYRVILTADHGNCEEMIDPETGEPNTQHTLYPVPFLLIGVPKAHLGLGRGLADVAPTVLDLLGIETPSAMTGHSLLLKPGLALPSGGA